MQAAEAQAVDARVHETVEELAQHRRERDVDGVGFDKFLGELAQQNKTKQNKTKQNMSKDKVGSTRDEPSKRT